MSKSVSLLDVALECAGRGWYVFPCKPRSKEPATRDGFKSATLDGGKIREWWGRNPQFNVAIACGASDLCVVDCDYGIQFEESNHAGSLGDLMDTLGLGYTFTVRTGRRPGFGAQIYLKGAIADSKFEVVGQHATYTGDVKSQGGYVMAAGSVHPSGELYTMLCGTGEGEKTIHLDATNDRVRALKKAQGPVPVSAEPITSDRIPTLLRIAGKFVATGMMGETLRAAMHAENENRCQPPVEYDEVELIVAKASKWAPPEEDVAVTIGKPVVGLATTLADRMQRAQDGANAARETASQNEGVAEPTPLDWKTLFHSRGEAENAPDVTFCIEGFLQREGVTAIAAPVRNRKTLISLNVVHSLVTGEPLFGKFVVENRPERVLYLVPESGLGPFTKNLRKLDLVQHVGDRLFFRTLSAEGKLSLKDLVDPVMLPAVKGAVIFLDTAVRFMEGDENSSQDMRVFGAELLALLKAGAEAVVLLHHSPKAQGDTMTLENALRGSGDIGAVLAACWGTRIQDIAKPYESPSYLSNLKQRDFESDPFEVGTEKGSARFTYIDQDGEVKLSNPNAFKGNKDGKDDVALALIKAHPKMSARELVELLKGNGIRRGKDWILQKQGEHGLKGAKTS